MLQSIRPSSTPPLQNTLPSSISETTPQGISSAPSQLAPSTASEPTNEKGRIARVIHQIAQFFQRCLEPFLRLFRKKNTLPSSPPTIAPSLPPSTPAPEPARNPPPVTNPPLPVRQQATAPTPGKAILQEPRRISIELDDACRNADLPAIRALIQQGALISEAFFLTQFRRSNEDVICELMAANGLNLNAADSFFHRTALQYACERGFPNALRQLLERGAQVETTDNRGRTPILYLLSTSNERDYTTDPVTWEMMLQLLRAGANLQDRQYGETPWRESLRRNFRENHVTPLTCAVAKKDLEAIRLLIRQGAPVNEQDYSLRHILLQACERENAEVIRTLVENGAEIETKDRQSRITALGISAFYGHPENIRTLASLGAEINYFDSYGNNPLHIACSNGQVACAQALIALGVPVDSITPHSRRGPTPLHIASSAGHEAVVRALAALGANLNATNRNLQTPLHLACAQEKESVVRALIELGAEVNLCDNGNNTPLSIAFFKKNLDLAKLLLSAGASFLPLFKSTLDLDAICHWIEIVDTVDLPDADGRTPLWHFLNNYLSSVPTDKDRTHRNTQPKLTILQLLLKAGAQVNLADKTGVSPFLLACEKGLDSCVEEMIKQEKGDLRSRDAQGNTPLHLAITSLQEKTLQIMIERGGDPNAVNLKGLTPLHSVCRQTDPLCQEHIDILLKAGANPLTVDANGNTALHHVARGEKEILQRLLNTGIPLDAQNAQGKTALHIAYQYANRPLAEALIEAGASTTILDQNNLTPEQTLNQPDEEGILPFFSACQKGRVNAIKNFLSYGIRIDALDENGFTPLHHASRSLKPEAITVLLAHNADPNASNNEEKLTPLHIACGTGLSSRTISALLNAGASAKALSKHGMSPLHCLAETLYPPRDVQSIISLLIAKGAPLEAQTTDGQTALQMAQANGYEKIVKALITAGTAAEAASSHS